MDSVCGQFLHDCTFHLAIAELGDFRLNLLFVVGESEQ